MPNYSEGKIYKIISDSTKKIYVGSTIKKYLSDRMGKHQSDLRRHLRGQTHYVTSFEILQRGDAKIILIETYPCSSKDELRAREQYWIDQFPNTVNKCKAYTGMTKQEYQKGYHDKYRQENKDKLAQQKKVYQQENKEKIAAKKKVYQQENKEKISARNSVCFTCDCGATYTRHHKLRHERTIKHQQWLTKTN